MHLVVEALENHEYKRRDERKCAGTQEVMGLAAQIHESGNQAHVDAVQEVTMALLVALVRITDTTQVDFPDTALFQPFDGLLIIAVRESPEMGEVVHHAMRDYAKGPTAAIVLTVPDHSRLTI